MIQPYELTVTTEPGEAVSIMLDPENTIDGPTYFVIEQVGVEIYLTIECLRELVEAAGMLEKNTRRYRQGKQ